MDKPDEQAVVPVTASKMAPASKTVIAESQSAPLTSAQLLAYREAIVAHCLGLFARECAHQGRDMCDDTRRLLAEVASFGVSHVRERALSDFVSAETVTPWVEKALQRPELLEPLGEWFGKSWRIWIQGLQSTEIPISEGLSESAFHQAFVWFVGDENRKVRWVHALVHNVEYRHMITCVIFEMIRQFFQDETLLSKLPGVGSFLKMGKWGVGKVLPQWEQLVEDTAKTFISKNLALVLKLSEHYLLESLTSDRVAGLGRQLWEALSQRAPSALFGVTDVLNEPALKEWTVAHWQVLVKKAFWPELIQPTVKSCVEAVCEITCGELWTVLTIPEHQLVVWNERLWCVLLSDLAENPEVAKLLSAFLAPCFQPEFLQTVLRSMKGEPSEG